MMIGRLCGKNHARKVGLGEVLQQEETDTKLLESFYRAMVKAIILYGSEKWVLPSSMANRIEGTHTGANDHGEESKAIRRWDIGDAGGRRQTKGNGEPVG